jgi:hypothetical protein
MTTHLHLCLHRVDRDKFAVTQTQRFVVQTGFNSASSPTVNMAHSVVSSTGCVQGRVITCVKYYRSLCVIFFQRCHLRCILCILSLIALRVCALSSANIRLLYCCVNRSCMKSQEFTHDVLLRGGGGRLKICTLSAFHFTGDYAYAFCWDLACSGVRILIGHFIIFVCCFACCMFAVA